MNVKIKIKMFLVTFLGLEYQGTSKDRGESVCGLLVGHDLSLFEAVFAKGFWDRWCIMVLISATDLLQQDWEEKFGHIAQTSELSEGAYQAENLKRFGAVDIGKFKIFSHWKVFRV